MAILVPIPSHQMKHVIQILHDTSWPVISPVTSEDEYSAKDSNSESGNEMLEADGHDSVANFQDDDISSPQSVCFDTTAARVTHTCFANVSTICGDNVLKQRYTRPDSVHYFHSYAVRDRIDFTCLSVLVPRPIASTLQQHALNLLPSPSDNHALCENFSILISCVYVSNIDFFTDGFQ